LEIIDKLNIASTNSVLDELYMKIVTMKKEEHSHILYGPEVALKLMNKLGYYDHDIAYLFTLFSGIANPYHFVKIQPGQDVLDLSCGIGVDTLIAKNYSKTGTVKGIDRCTDEINLAREIAKKRNLDVQFLDMKVDDYFKTNDPEFESCQKYDVILSNGPHSVH
jgi:2-polyprenyl-3-methyl-5-hydroxy-6-metoxy-1,4-benzoquinol methylase